MSRAMNRRFEKGSTILNGYCMIPDAFAAEAFARQGFDAVTIDLQHGLADFGDTLAMIQALGSCDVVPMVRVPWLDPGLLMRLLDAGIMGVTCPTVGTVEQAELFVRYTSYPPRGERSYGPIRAGLVHGSDYGTLANDAIVRIVMIETAEGLENVEAIAAVPGLSGLYIGQVDLALSLGRPIQGEGDPIMDAALDRIVAAGNASGIFVGTAVPNPQRAVEMYRRGFRFFTMGTDVSAMQQQAKSWIDTYKKLSAGAG